MLGSWMPLLSLEGMLSQIMPEVFPEVAEVVEAPKNVGIRLDWFARYLGNSEVEGPAEACTQPILQ